MRLDGAVLRKAQVSRVALQLDVLMAKVGWTDEARAASIEARRANKDLTDPEAAGKLKDFTRQIADMKGNMTGGVNSAERIVTDHGQIYPFSAASFKGPRGEQHGCFMNAGRIAISDASKKYVEGYISVHGIPIHHAWLVNEKGQVEDPTLKDGSAVSAYFGVPFKQDYVLRTALKTKVWGIMSHTNRSFFTSKPSKYLAKFDPSQPRDDHGRWTDGDGNAPTAEDLLRLHSTGDETIADVEKHLTPEQIKAVQDAEQSLVGLETTQQQFKLPDGTYTADRAKLHEAILNDMFSKEKIEAATPKPGEDPTLTMTGGRPAAGKTSALRDELSEIGDKSFYLSADTIQESLPGYRGDHAGLFNGEAQDIVAQAEKIARSARINITYDATMKSQQPALDRVKDYKDAGYKVDGYFVHTSPVTSAVRSVQRYQSSGRYVPPYVSLKSRSNEKTFDALRPQLDRWALYDNNGSSPKLIARGANTTSRSAY